MDDNKKKKYFEYDFSRFFIENIAPKYRNFKEMCANNVNINERWMLDYLRRTSYNFYDMLTISAYLHLSVVE